MEQLLAYVTEQGIKWVNAQRDRYRPVGVALTPEVRRLLSPFFPPLILAEVIFVPVSAIDNPPFLLEVQQFVPKPLPNFSEMMEGITFDNTICLKQSVLEGPMPGWLSLIFHECVHACQYKQLGVKEFMRRYVRGWALNGFEYRSIPLEQHAYELQDRFQSAKEPFAVEPMVRTRLSAEA